MGANGVLSKQQRGTQRALSVHHGMSKLVSCRLYYVEMCGKFDFARDLWSGPKKRFSHALTWIPRYV